MSSFPNSETFTPSPPFRTPSILEGARRASNASILESSAHANAHGGLRPSMSPHQSITYNEPVRPAFPARLRASARGESHRSMSEAMRIARSREEQEELLDDEEQADDDGCYPPRKNDDPRAPNPHGWLPVYTTIHKIRRLVVASIGRSSHLFSLVFCQSRFDPAPCKSCLAGAKLAILQQNGKGVPLTPDPLHRRPILCRAA